MRIIYVVCFLLLLPLQRGWAEVISLDTPFWYEFSFTLEGVPAQGCAPADPGGVPCAPSSAGNSSYLGTPPWTFTASGSGAVLMVTDAFLAGDAFSVADFGSSIGSTATVSASDRFCGSDPEDCILDPEISSGSFMLLPGTHSITITPLIAPFASPGRADAAYFRVITRKIPEPARGPLTAGFLIAAIAAHCLRSRLASSEELAPAGFAHTRISALQ